MANTSITQILSTISAIQILTISEFKNKLELSVKTLRLLMLVLFLLLSTSELKTAFQEKVLWLEKTWLVKLDRDLNKQDSELILMMLIHKVNTVIPENPELFIQEDLRKKRDLIQLLKKRLVLILVMKMQNHLLAREMSKGSMSNSEPLVLNPRQSQYSPRNQDTNLWNREAPNIKASSQDPLE